LAKPGQGGDGNADGNIKKISSILRLFRPLLLAITHNQIFQVVRDRTAFLGRPPLSAAVVCCLNSPIVCAIHLMD
jgi:hypothetical protein